MPSRSAVALAHNSFMVKYFIDFQLKLFFIKPQINFVEPRLHSQSINKQAYMRSLARGLSQITQIRHIVSLMPTIRRPHTSVNDV